jgi:hypothetical protein
VIVTVPVELPVPDGVAVIVRIEVEPGTTVTLVWETFTPLVAVTLAVTGVVFAVLENARESFADVDRIHDWAGLGEELVGMNAAWGVHASVDAYSVTLDGLTEMGEEAGGGEAFGRTANFTVMTGVFDPAGPKREKVRV